MTLIVGILCSDGVVIAADSAATMGSLGNRTVIQPTKKLEIISERMVLGVSGAVGLGQKFAYELTHAYSASEFAGKDPVEAMSMISDKFRAHLYKEFQAAQAAMPIVGNGVASSPAITMTVVGMVIGEKAHLFQFDHQGASEMASEGLPFVSVGSGQPIADPFLSFLRRIFWPNSTPNLNDGIFAALWTLQHAITVNPGGVAGPIHIVTLSQEPTGKGAKTTWVARELSADELQEHGEAVQAAEDKLQHFKDEIVDSTNAPDIPTAVAR